MQRAFVAGIIISIICPLVGNFVVAKRLSLFSDTLAHVVFAGLAFGSVLRISPTIVGVVFAIAGALILSKMVSLAKLTGEQALALLLSSAAALASIFITIGRPVNLASILFGSILFVTWNDIIVITVLASIISYTMLSRMYDFLLLVMDKDLAKIRGIKVEMHDLTLSLLAALAIVVSVTIAGVLLVSSLMAIPVIAAMQISRSFKSNMILSLTFGLISVLVGIIVAYYLAIPSGGAVALTNITIFTVCSALGKKGLRF